MDENACELKIKKTDSGVVVKYVCDDEEREINENLQNDVLKLYQDVKEILKFEPEEITIKKEEDEFRVSVMDKGEEIAEGSITNEKVKNTLEEVFE